MDKHETMPCIGYYDVAKGCNHWTNLQQCSLKVGSFSFANCFSMKPCALRSRPLPLYIYVSCDCNKIGGQNGKVPHRMIRLHTYLCYECLGVNQCYSKVSYASPTLMPAITDLPYRVISQLRVTAHCPKCGHGLIYSVNKL